MKLVIDIPKDVKNRLAFGVTYEKDIRLLCEAIGNGISLPKGHCKLIDADEYERIIKTYIDENKNSDDMFLAGCGDGAYHAMCMLKDISTIIEADGGEEDGEDTTCD